MKTCQLRLDARTAGSSQGGRGLAAVAGGCSQDKEAGKPGHGTVECRIQECERMDT